VFGHPFPQILGQGFPQQCGHMPEFLGEALAGTSRIRLVHPDLEDQASVGIAERPSFAR